jgi:hypothetical protein
LATQSGRRFRPRFVTLGVIIIAILAVALPVQHYLLGFVIPYLRHHGLNRFQTALVLTPAIVTVWYSVCSLLMAWLSAWLGNKHAPGWAGRALLVEGKPIARNSN